MMVVLILAQLVLPGPWLDSPRVQPGPTICVGECAGPVVWGPAERGRLVVACDMRSDTCSDGRKITTTRATPVPCEVAPGQWEMVPEDTGCYSVRGLESWAQNTSYLSWGAELDRSPWGGAATATPHGSTYLVCAETGSSFRQQLRAEEGGVVRTAACLVRAGTSRHIRLLAADVSSGGVNFDYELTDDWQTVTATATIVEGGGIAGVRLHPARSGAGCVEVAGCWSVRGDIPGRPCWGGEAPVTCAADRHTISTEGWPTEAGEVEIVFNYGQVIRRPERLIDGRSIEDLQHFTLFISSLPGNPLTLSLDTTVIVQSPSLSWEEGKVYRVRVRRTLDGEIELFRDGVRVAAASGPPLSWSPRAVLGGRYDSINSQQLNGSISSLRVRSFE